MTSSALLDASLLFCARACVVLAVVMSLWLAACGLAALLPPPPRRPTEGPDRRRTDR